MRLGRKPPHPRVHAHHRVRLASFLGASLPDVPDACDWSATVTEWEMGRNDEIGDCAIVGPANSVIAWTTNAGGAKRLSLASILDAYKALGGWDGIAGDATDGGCVISDVLAGWANVGIGGDKIDAFAEVDHSSRDQIKRSIAIFGVCIVGLLLPVAAQRWGTQPWPVIGSASGDSSLTPGGWGGHCVALVGYDNEAAFAITWGQRVRIPWPTVAIYLEEAWAVVSCDFLDSQGDAPSGLHLGAMIAGCQAMRDQT